MNKEIVKQENKLRKYILNNFDNEFISKLKNINSWRTVFTFFHIWLSILISFLIVNLVIFSYGIYSTIWLLPIALFIATRQNALAVQIHEAAHYHLFVNRNVNDLFCNLFASYWILNDVESYRTNHLRHHRHLHTFKDPDKELYSIKNNKKINIFLFFQDLTLITAVKRIFVYTDKKNNYNKKKNSGLYHNIIKVITQILVFLLCFFIQDNDTGILIWIIFWIIPLFCILPVIVRIRIVAEHFEEESLKISKFTSRTTKGNLITNFLLGSCMEYHFEHHVIPYIPHYNLKVLSNELEKKSILKQDNEYNYDDFKNSGYIDYWMNLLKNKI